MKFLSTAPARSLLAAGMVLVSLTACQRSSRLLPEHLSGSKEVLVTGVRDVDALYREARREGVEVRGRVVLELRGAPEAIARLHISNDETPLVARNEAIEIVRPESEVPKEELLFMARREFGLERFWQAHPEFDGRGVIAGVIDDGISPSQSGFVRTSGGLRKILAKESNSSLFTFAASEGTAPGPFGQSIPIARSRNLYGIIDESTLVPIGLASYYDLNANQVQDRIEFAVLLHDATSTTAASTQICVDANANRQLDDGECFGNFPDTGEFGFWDSQKIFTITATFDATSSNVKFSPGERRTDLEPDSHGEGVASVLGGSRIAGRFDGVAPGVQLLDYDLSEPAKTYEESVYTMSTFINALEWMGRQRAQVVNISYSLFFLSAQSQEFMRRALDNLVQKYGYVISFSAGNNGPGFGSLNRRGLYPQSAIVAGAFVSKEMDEAVHGVSGLPPEGRVVFYSSRGPGYDAGSGPVIISPLASLTHSSPAGGFSAFSGTSSASPAAAGLAAVIISAAKARGLPIDPTAVVHALRLSGKRLPGVAFVDQGFGLPQADLAWAHYQKLITGDQFSYLNSTVRGVSSPDLAAASGVLLTEQDATQDVEVRVSLTGIPAPVVKASRRSEMLRPLEVRMSDKAIKGPQRLWTSVSASILDLSVKVKELARSTPKGKAWLGEVELRDAERGDLLHVIPISFINRHPLNTTFVSRYSIPAEEGERFFFVAEQAGSAIRVRLRHDNRLTGRLQLRIYDPSRKIVRSRSIAGQENEFYIPVTEAGEYQVTLGRSGGTETPVNGEIQVNLVDLSIRNEYLSPPSTAGGTNPTQNLRIDNRTGAQVTGRIFARLRRVNLLDMPVRADSAGDLRFETRVTGPVEVFVDEPRPAIAPLQTLARWNCLVELVNDAGVVLARQFGMGLNVLAGQSGTLKARCRAFDGNFGDQTIFRVAVWQEGSAASNRVFEGVVRLEQGLNSLGNLVWSGQTPATGSELELFLEPLFATGPVSGAASALPDGFVFLGRVRLL